MTAGSMRHERWRIVIAGWVIVALTLGAVAARAQEATPAPAADQPAQVQPGDTTAARPYLAAIEPADIEITPILTAGEFVGEYQMAGNPTGIGAYLDGNNAIVSVTHAWRPQDVGHRTSSRVSRLVLDPDTGGVRSGSYPVDGTQDLWSLTAATVLDGPGFDEPRFLTGEASTLGPNGGISVLIDDQGDVMELPWIGAFMHQGWVRLPGFGDRVVLIGTDSDPRGSELYMYVANTATGLRAGQGRLSVFVAEGAASKDDPVTGKFVPIPLELAESPAELQQAANDAGAFAFVRLGGVTYDRTTTSTFYVADAGDGRGVGGSTNGRIYRIALDPEDLAGDAELSVILDGDDGDDIRNPDGIAASDTTLMIQENLVGSNLGSDSAQPSRLLAFDFETEELTAIALVDQSDDPDKVVDKGGRAGAWGQSGITEASAVFGDGAWLVTVQARTLRVQQFDGKDEGGQLLLIRFPPTGPATPVPSVTATSTATAEATGEPTTEPTTDPIIDPPTEVPPTPIPPTPTDVPPTPTDVPPTPTDVPPTPTEEVVPTEIPPTPTEEVVPTEIPPTPTEPVFEPTPTEPA